MFVDNPLFFFFTFTFESVFKSIQVFSSSLIVEIIYLSRFRKCCPLNQVLRYMEETKQFGVQFSNADAVVELRVKVHTTEGIKLFDVHLRDTIRDIKERVCDEVTEQFGKTYACEPDVFMMLHFPSLKVLDGALSQTLFEVLDDAGIVNDVNQFPETVVVELFPIG
ncbi:hypothetical protein RND81_10G229300 [Saponaria officinalis]|uniref:Uncharacterized protein n=1 Tax=Saponaria officinalis TaxID=3572 RepID=A0AAW1I5J7_SAPOF